MVDKATKLRWRRRVRRSQKHVENIGVQAEQHLELNFFNRLSRLVEVRRFVAAWLLLLLLLIGGVVVQLRRLPALYQQLQPESGGSYSEGILGSFTNANPLYATNSVDTSVSRLVFASLLKYDAQNKLVGDLAQSIVGDDRAITYTVTLKPNLMWHDGKPLTADDILFTYQTIQNPDAKSPLFPNWQGVKIEQKDPRTIVFTLPHGLASFPDSLTTGIIPKHWLANINANQLRSVAFNTTNPIGAGPFKFGRVEVVGETQETREERVGLEPNENYHGGKPKIDAFTIRAFRDERRLIRSLETQELDAAAGLEDVPEGLRGKRDVMDFNVPLNAEVMVFLKNSQPILQDVKVRQAIVQATDTASIISGLNYPVIATKSPLLRGDIGYSKDIVQLSPNQQAAQALLDQAGWIVGADGIRAKADQRLTFRLYSQSNSQYAYVSQELQKQWRAIGVDAQVILQPESELQTTIAFHTYDALLFGIALGTDPDVYAYWHSSQADPRSASRLNFSEYKSNQADQALEGGRARSDAALRAAKYKPFLQAWRNDAPAVALYQPRFLYVTYGKLYNFAPTTFNSPTDRYTNVQNWMIREQRTNIVD